MRPPPSLNVAEIAHFARLSAQWWSPTGELAMLHRMNPLRVRYVRDKLVETARDDGDAQGASTMLHTARPFRGLSVLDVGCGGGVLSESLARLGAHTLGVDLAKENIAIAGAHAERDPRLADSPDLAYEHASVESLVLRPERFDVVCLMEVIEHVDQPASFISAAAELVKPGGHLFISTLPRHALSYFLTIAMAEHVLKLVSPGTHTHSKYVNPSELVDFFHSDLHWISTLYNGQPPRVEAEYQGMAYVPWSGEWTLMPRWAPASSYANYMFWARKPR